MQVESFPLSSTQCEVLMAFETSGSLAALADHFKRDVSVMSRQLQAIAQTLPVLQKQKGKWVLTPLGKQVCARSRDYLYKINLVTRQKTSLRIGSTREFCARILTRALPQLTKEFGPQVELSVFSSDQSIERMLLDGTIDYGFDCGRPNDPSIRYKLIKSESFGIFASSALLQGKKIRKLETLVALPSLEFHRIQTARYLGLNESLTNVVCRFNDLSAIRSACVTGLGWAVLPNYAVHDEIREKKLVRVLPDTRIQSEMFGVWSLRNQTHLIPILEKAAHWLKQQPL